MSRVCVITWVPKLTRKNMYQKKHKIAMNVVTLTTCKRSLAILGQHNTKKKVGASTGLSLKEARCDPSPPNLKVAGYLESRLKSIYSYKKVLLLLTTSPYKMSLHTLLNSFCFFLVFNNSILSLQKASKRQTRWSYKLTWHLKTLTKRTLENPQLCLLGVLLQKGPVRGLFVTTKWPYINHL